MFSRFFPSTRRFAAGVCLSTPPSLHANHQRQAYTLANGSRVPQLGVAVVVLRKSPSLNDEATASSSSLAATPCLDPSTQPCDVLLVRRGKMPMKGWYGLPGGKLEFGETIQEAGAREVSL